MNRNILCFLICAIFTIKYATAQVFYPGDLPGKAMIKKSAVNQTALENNVINIMFKNNGGKISIQRFENKKTHEQLNFTSAPLFELTLQDGSMVTSNQFALDDNPVGSDITADNHAIIHANRFAGKKYKADFVNKKLGLKVRWEADLRDSSNYIRQIFSFSAFDSVKIHKISLVNLPGNIAVRKKGTVDGSPIVHKNMFFAVEHPMSQFEQNASYSNIFLLRSAPISTNVFTISSVWGVTPVNQMRRGFLYYVERQRANPYHQFLHYNSWYDLSYADRTLNDSLCLDRVKLFGDSLITKRSTKLKAFLFDDGWDDYKTLWQFNSGFPNGFANLRKAAESLDAGIGVWLSPWGGYDIRKPQRIEYGKKQIPPFETNENGFSLTGPVYYNRFKKVTSDFINKYNVIIFKFDGVGAGNGASGASIDYQKDIEAFLLLLSELRKLKPDLYLSLTIGTWPSVYWLLYGDATWRAGDDTGLEGKGSLRQQWITYRSAEAYKNIVLRSPLYPLNAVMYHGITIADQGIPGKLEMNDKDIADEIWSFFGTGTSLQEMYINPHKLNSENWDCLAKSISWVRENKNVLADVHWVGGDPAKEEVYGYAAWSKDHGVLTLRNPSQEKKSFLVDVNKLFELPEGFHNNYLFFDARAQDPNNKMSIVGSGKSFTISLEPFEVKVMNAKASER